MYMYMYMYVYVCMCVYIYIYMTIIIIIIIIIIISCHAASRRNTSSRVTMWQIRKFQGWKGDAREGSREVVTMWRIRECRIREVGYRMERCRDEKWRGGEKARGGGGVGDHNLANPRVSGLGKETLGSLFRKLPIPRGWGSAAVHSSWVIHRTP